MKPELRPPSLTRKAGSSLSEGLHNLSILLSLMEASSWTAMDRKSRAFQKKNMALGVNYFLKGHEAVLLPTNLCWIFSMEIPTRNGFTSFCKYHLVRPLRWKKKKKWKSMCNLKLFLKKCDLLRRHLLFHGSMTLKDTGLSVALLISVLMMFCTNIIVSFAIPCTCIQRNILIKKQIQTAHI